MKRLGLLSPPTWNARTGNIVGGHQRVAVIDSLKGTQDYRLRVATVDLDDAREREANLLLNNGLAQGDWDIQKLEEIFRTPDLNLDGTGFDAADVYRLFGDSPFADRAPGELDELAEKLREARKKYEDTVSKSVNRDNDHFYLVVVFKDDEDRFEFLSALGLDDNRYQDGRELRRLYGLAQEKAEGSKSSNA